MVNGQTYPPGGTKYRDAAPGELFVNRTSHELSHELKVMKDGIGCKFPGTDELAAELEMTPLPDQKLGPG